VLGPHRAAATCYGVLASAWYEFAPPSDKLEGKKRPTPGDWVAVDYRQFMAFVGTRARASITRWLRILAEDLHECPWGRCADEHPLIVVRRQGQNKPNLYRKWRCGEDVLLVRPRVRSAALSAVARQRIASGQILNGSYQERPLSYASSDHEAQLGLSLSSRKTTDESSETTAGRLVISLPDLTRKTYSESLGRLVTDLPEDLQQFSRKTYDESSLRRKDIKIQKAAEKGGAAALEVADNVDAVACELVDAILALAQRVEPAYTDDQAWAVARRLAAAALAAAQHNAAAARSLVLRAIADRRLSRARNPVGLLLRGVLGDDAGEDRFLLAETAIDARAMAAIRAHGYATLPTPAEEDPQRSDTPLCDELAARDPDEYRRRLEEILAGVEIPANLGVRRSLDHPMLLGMCRARLERELGGDR
jgi:hypothetical protein